MTFDAPSQILIVEDEPALLDTLQYNLEKHNYRVHTAITGQDALRLARTQQPDLIVLDIMLPVMNGLDVCRILRQEGRVPILMLTARDSETDRVKGLEIGADDYLTKPFSMRELLARVKALLRRVQFDRADAGARDPMGDAQTLVVGDLIVDVLRHEVTRNGEPIALKPKEFDLLVYFARHKGQALSRDELMARVWGWDFTGGSRTVDVHIRWLREKIEPDPANPVRIVTVRGAGYRFEG